MKEHLVLFSKIIAKSSLKFALIIVPGLILCLIAIITSYIIISNTDTSAVGHTAHTGSGILIFLTWFMIAPWSATLFFTSIIVFPVLYFITANKTAMQTGIYLLWENKFSGWIAPKVSHYVDKLETKQPNWLKQSSDKAVVKAQLLDSFKNDPETPKFQRRVLGYLLKKVHLDDVEFKQENIKVSHILSDKLLQKLGELAQPSGTLSWIVFGSHILLVLLAIVLE